MSELIITDVRVNTITPKEGSKLLAFAKITLNGQFAVGGLRIFDGKNGIFVAYPQEPKKNPEDKGYDIAHPITKEAREMIQQQVLAEFDLQRGASA